MLKATEDIISTTHQCKCHGAESQCWTILNHCYGVNWKTPNIENYLENFNLFSHIKLMIDLLFMQINSIGTVETNTTCNSHLKAILALFTTTGVNNPG